MFLRDYIACAQRLGRSDARNIIVLPVLFEGQVKAVLELASFADVYCHRIWLSWSSLRKASASCSTRSRPTCGRKIAQAIAIVGHELQSAARELQQTNQELRKGPVARRSERRSGTQERRSGASAAGLGRKSQAARAYVASTNRNSWRTCRTSCARRSIACSSCPISCRRTPTEPYGAANGFAKTIHSSGNDLLTLINDILDLSKIESGTVSVDADRVCNLRICETIERKFRHDCRGRGH